MRCSFVVLHHKTPEETLRCTDLIRGLEDSDSVHVIIVDNGSHDCIGQEVAARWSESEVTVAELVRNVGFARGHNVGYAIAKHRWQSEFVVLMNSDVMICQSDFLSRLRGVYESAPFSVLGPDIVATGGLHQNPIRCPVDSVSTADRQLALNRLRLLANRLPGWATSLGRLLWARTRARSDSDWRSGRIGACLHGACLVLGPEFVSSHELALDPCTFMYGEEDILHLQMRQEGAVCVYEPSLQVLHTEDASVRRTFSCERARRDFILTNSIASTKALRRLLKEQGSQATGRRSDTG